MDHSSGSWQNTPSAVFQNLLCEELASLLPRDFEDRRRWKIMMRVVGLLHDLDALWYYRRPQIPILVLREIVDCIRQIYLIHNLERVV